MPDEMVDRVEPPEGQPRQEPPLGAQPPGAESPRARHVKNPRRSWKRWLANLMIVVGVLLLAYPIGTWGYTWFAQRDLSKQLTQSDPGFAAAEAALNTGALGPLSSGTAQAGTSATSTSTTVDDSGPTTSTSTIVSASSTVTTVSPAESQRLAELAAFRAAAEQFAAKVGWKTGTPLGRIVIPSISLNVVMVEGTGKGDLREGPGHWPETPFPGQGGNFVVSGHRTTYGAPFFKINKVKVGDEIDLVLPYGVVRYAVTRVIIVNPTDVQTVAQLGKEQVSLAACHPIYSAKQRIVVQGDLVAFKLVHQ
jgi:LPXTG-site transpeptidase (sortase) family protein